MSVSGLKTNLLDLDHDRLKAFFKSLGEQPFRAEQILKWIYHQRVIDFDAMTNISTSLREKLGQVAEIRLPGVITEQRSSDGTRKWLLAVGVDNAIECVFIPEPGRGTLCISSQVGCALNCSFCSTATQGFSRNLTTAEIIGQIWVAAGALGHDHNTRRITNVVLMGMGEPLLNFDALAPALGLMKDTLAFGFAGKRVTVSTAGLIPGIDRLNATIDVSLAVSLHAPNDELRSQLVPLNRKYPIDDLLAACRRYVAQKQRARITFEYTLMDGVNDSEALARALVKRLRTVPSKLNLIPFNPFPGTQYRCSSSEAIARFQRIVMDAGIVTTVRKTRGNDIDAACGQLVGRVRDRTRRQERYRARLVDAQPLVSDVGVA